MTGTVTVRFRKHTEKAFKNKFQYFNVAIAFVLRRLAAWMTSAHRILLLVGSSTSSIGAIVVSGAAVFHFGGERGSGIPGRGFVAATAVAFLSPNCLIVIQEVRAQLIE